MTQNAKQDKKELNWMMATMVLPMVLLMNFGRDLGQESVNRVIFSGLFAGLGVGIGYLFYYFSKKKSTAIRIAAIVFETMICVIALVAFRPNPTDNELIGRKWKTQKLGEFEFDTPSLFEGVENNNTFIKSESIKIFNSVVEEKYDRKTLYLKVQLKSDSAVIANIFQNMLSGLIVDSELARYQRKFEVMEEETFENGETIYSAKFSLEHEGEKFNGMGYLQVNGKVLESLWLIPQENSFSDDYIEEFEFGIIPFSEKSLP